MGFLQRLQLKAVMQVVSHPRLTLVLAGAVLLASALLAWSRLNISTDQNKLFSSNVPFFRDYLTFINKFPENEAIYVVIQPHDPNHAPPVKRWTDLADRITQRLRALPQHVKSVDCRVPLDQLGQQGLLLEDPKRLAATFQDAKRFVSLVKLWGEAPGALTGLLGSIPIERFLTAMGLQAPDEETARFLHLLAASWIRTLENPSLPLKVGEQLPDLTSLDATDPSRLGYYYVPDDSDPRRHVMLVRVYHRENFTSLTAITKTVEAIRRAVADAAGAFPEFSVGITGRLALDADQMQTTDRDSHRAEMVALSVVFVGLVFMLRSVWLALLAEISLAVGIGWTFGYATLAVGELNLLSVVFLIALIGIGMDYLIQILAAYRREAQRYVRPAAIWTRVFFHVGPPIFTACLGAAGAFLVSVFTPFRGAADLGIIAGGGLLLCLAAGYTVLPALLVLFPAKFSTTDPRFRYDSGGPSARGGGWRLILPVIWIVALIIAIPLALRTRFNPNLLELQAPNLESVKLVRKLQTWSAVVLTRDLSMLRKVRDAVKDAPAVASTESILSAYDNEQWLRDHQSELPPIAWRAPTPVRSRDLPRLASTARALADRWEQAAPVPTTAPAPETARQQAIAALRTFATKLDARSDADAARLAQALSSWQVAFLDQLRDIMAQFHPTLNVAALPQEVRSHLVSADGYYALYIYPKEDLWNRQSLTRFVQEVEERVAQVPGAPRVTGIASDIYHTTSAIERSFYYATLYAFILIFVLVLLDLRRLGQTLAAISVLAFGLPMLVGLMGLLGVSWNFANFFGLPILIGAAHEYGVFMVHRYREAVHDPKRVWRRWDVADRALLLCAFVTSSSFGFFWAIGHHKGLKSLGLVMALGCACIYLATLLVVRPLLLWRLRRRGLA